MKALLPLAFVVISAFAWAGDAPVAAPSPGVIKGEVLETKEAGSYSYLRLKTAEGETWVAITKAEVREGSQVTIVNAMEMNDFESKSLQRTFPTIFFGSLAGPGGAMPSGHGAGASTPTDLGDIQVPKASGENAYTVAEIIAKAAELKDKPVVVAGKVVKYNPRIMDRNWVHLRDGTGSAEDGTNDILVTTQETTAKGEVVTVSGIVRTDQDFGAGYAYKVLIDGATLRK